MCNWLQTVGQQYRPAEKQNLPLQVIPEQAAAMHQFASTLPVQHQQNPQGNTPRRSQLQSLQNPALNRQQSNQQQSQQISSHPQLSNQLSHQISGQPINSQVELQLNSQKGFEQSEIHQKSFENSQEDLDNQFQSQNIKLIPQDQPTPSPIEPKKPVYPLNKQQSVLSKTNQPLGNPNKTLKKSQTQSNPMLLQPLQQKPPQIQLHQNNTPRDQSLAQMKSSQGGSNQQSKLNPSEHEPPQEVVKFEILKSIDDYMRLQIADAISIHNYNARDVVFKDKGDNFYLIQSGKLRALKMEEENEGFFYFLIKIFEQLTLFHLLNHNIPLIIFNKMIQCLFLVSRQGKTRLTKWYNQSLTTREKQRFLKEINSLVLTRGQKMCNFLEYVEYKIVYKRYASLYFIAICDKEDNELLILEIIHHFVEVLDKYFGNVCELDLIFNFHKAYYILDELLLGGFIQEPSKKIILKAITSQEALIEEANDDQSK